MLPSPPTIQSLFATPNPAAVNTSVTFTTLATDSQSLVYAWDFGDGSSATGSTVTHTFSVIGDYQVSVAVTDAAQTTTTQSLLVHVGNPPTARFTTNDVVGFVGLPFTFDATLSTDPENAITIYSWNFGDGSPSGSTQVISKVFNAEGTYAVALTTSDAEGLQATTQRLVEILPADQIGVSMLLWSSRRPSTEARSPRTYSR